MHETQDLLRSLALVLGVAAVTTLLFQRLRQPVVFGYMLAGLIVGPHVPVPLVADERSVHTLAELGVVLLMFSLGLEFDLRRMLRVGWPVVMIAVLQSSLMLWLGFEMGHLLGWSTLASFYAGAAVAISSTTIVVKAFAEQRVEGRFKDLVFGILIIQDLIAILLLALLTPGAGGGSVAASLGGTIAKLVAVLAGLLLLGMLLVPRLVRYVASLGSNEMTLVVSIGICFLSALLVREAGYSVALGAFLAGSFVAESGESARIERLIEPLRDMFVAIFFVSVGMQIVPGLVAANALEILAFTLVVLFGMVGAVTVATFLTGAGVRTAVQTGMSLGQIGEFSYIIAGAGIAKGVVPPALFPVVVAVSAVTALTTPVLIRSAAPVAAWIDTRLPRPLQTFTALYATWIESLSTHPGTSAEQLRMQRALRALAFDACVIVVLCIGASLVSAPLDAALVARFGLSLTQARAIVAAVAVLSSLPFLLSILRTGRGLGQVLSERAFPLPTMKRLDMAAAPRRALVVAVQFATVVAVGVPLVAITRPFLPAFAGVATLAACVLVLGFYLWRSAADLHGHFRAAAEVMVAAIGRQNAPVAAAQPEDVLQRAYQLLPGLGEPVPVRIEAGTPFVDRALAAVGLRGRTGATILAISRGNDVVLVPDGHEVLRAGDMLAVAGTRESVEAARALLAGMPHADIAPEAPQAG